MSEFNEVSIPERYEIYQQDLSKDYLQLIPMGYVYSIEQARAMCKVFRECDKDCDSGNHTYIFRCVKVRGED